ncbi:maleylacetate reductase [Bradyrhizobium sp. CER78]|uniref:maleylacetate reductase n=1 Tax=Bradyrhizobium sp. CER78 TaxID=3039162 RepID=UPI002448E4F8|nr:maleylacetate reductase [Bradyrhizobium sp. CER78]MDH2384483.1 maleylacetate reductase [Bradyrhizobium sp. CER78]
MMPRFTFSGLPTRVVFGSRTIGSIGSEVERLDRRRAFVVCSAAQQREGEMVCDLLGRSCSDVYAGAVLHTPTSVTKDAMHAMVGAVSDCIVSIGGGSAIGLGKALALRTGIPQICVPTTYAGSEMTPILGQTEDAEKTTLADPAILPKTVIYDVELTKSLPKRLAAASGLNAIAHAAEALYAQNGNPIIGLLAQEGIAALIRSLPQIVSDPIADQSRSDALYGAWLCGVCLGSVGMALHHKLCHVVAGSFDLPHAETHAILLPYALAYNLEATPTALEALRTATGSNDPARKIYDLSRALDLPVSLGELGFGEDNIDRATTLTMKNSYWNPRPFDHSSIREILRAACGGRPPKTVRVDDYRI